MDERQHNLGAFRLTRRLGAGGMAEVWAATHATFGGEAAVKVMLASVSGSQRFRDAFVSEARSHAGLEHRHIVRLLDYGAVSKADRPPPGVMIDDAYLVMELAASTVRDDALPRSWDDVEPILLDVLDGLAHSHARGFIHRDLKPENVLRFGDESFTYKLADFGIAHSVNLDETADRDTLSVTVGTPHYMAPEQFRGQWYEFGPATDLYAVGCMAFELVSGRVPFPQTALVELATAHLTKQPPALAPRFDVPPGLDGWIRRLMQKDPRSRFAFAADAAHALSELSTGFRGAATSRTEHGSAAPTVVLDDAETIVDALTDLIMGETLDAIDVGSLESDPPTTALAPPRPAPFTGVWKALSIGAATHQLGLGLFALRETPVVGFDDIREQLWAALGQVVEDEGPRVVVLRGQQHAPVSALGTWLARRAAKTAAAVTHDAFYTRAGGPREGLVALLEDAFGTWGMGDDEAVKRIHTYVARSVPAEVAAPCAAIASDLVLGARGAASSGGRIASRGERHRAVAEILESTAPARPYLVWVSDAQWGGEAFAFAQRVLERSRPGLVVLGVASDELGGAPQTALEALLELDGVAVVEVREPKPDEQRLLANAMLPLDEQSASRVAGLAGGDEVVMRLLLDQLRADEALEPTPDGYRLQAGAAIPPTRLAVVADAVSRCVSRRPELLDALEIAALLGRAPDPVELRLCCAELEVFQPDLVGPLVENGFAHALGTRWWFTHDAVVDVLAQSALRRQRWDQIQLACARVLLARAASDSAELFERAARHFVAGGDSRAALEPMFRAMRLFLKDDVQRARAILREYDDVCDQLELSPETVERVRGAFVRMVLLRTSGALDDSARLAAQTAELARDEGLLVEEGLVLRHLARLESAARQSENVVRLLARAEHVAELANNPLEQAGSARALGQFYDQLGDFERALSALERACELYAAAGGRAAQASTMSVIASVLQHADRVDEARQWGEDAMRLAGGCVGVAGAEASNMLGELARARGDFAAAREYYREARTQFALGAVFNVQIMDLNLALVDLAEGEWDTAAHELLRLKASFDRARLLDVSALASAGLATCAAAQGREAEVLERLSEIDDALGDTADPEVIDVLEIALNVTPNPSPIAACLAAHHRRAGNLARAAEVDALV